MADSHEREQFCQRCGAPGSPRFRGGRLIPMTGLRRETIAGGRKRRLFAHADVDFCRRRMPAGAVKRTARVKGERDPSVHR